MIFITTRKGKIWLRVIRLPRMNVLRNNEKFRHFLLRRIRPLKLRRANVFFLLDLVLISGIIFLIFSQPRSLQDYEQRCRETPDPKEKVALEAVKFLVRQNVPDSIAHQVDQEVAKENLTLPADTLLFPEIPAAMNDSLAGLYEAQLADNLSRLYHAKRTGKNEVANANLPAARKIAAQLDKWGKYDYWVPLMDFLDKADAEVWQRWRVAVNAANMSRSAYLKSEFQLAQFFAVHGLRGLADIPDRRLQLDLYLRLQNAIAEGPESVFNIGFALGDWITQECLAIKHYLRVASSEFNIGNQFMLTGRFEEAFERFKSVLRFAQQWRHIRHMEWYKSECMVGSARALYQIGDYSLMLHYLHLYSRLAPSTRQKTLYHINRGLAARIIGDLQTAEAEFQKALTCGKGDEKNNIEADPANVWYAYLELGNLFLDYNLPEKALLYFQNAKAYVANLESFLNAERLSAYWLYLAQAFVQKQDMASAKKALESAKKQFIDSPFLRVKSCFTAATLYKNLSQFEESVKMLTEAREICQNYGMVNYEFDAILQQAALSFKTEKYFKLPRYPAEELEKVLARVNKSGDKQQLINALALAIDAASHAGQYEQAKRYANWLLKETAALSRLYDQEQRLIFFQHSTYDNVKAAIKFDIQLAHIDSAFVKLDYIKGRALCRRFKVARISNDTKTNMPYVDIDTLQNRLRSNEAVINYMVTDDILYVFTLTKFALQVFHTAINRRELQAQVDEYLEQLATDDHRQQKYDEQHLRDDFLKTVKLSHNLYNTLLGQMAETLAQSDRLYIIPDEFLHALPFSTLVVRNDLEPDFLVNSKATMYLPNASILFNPTTTNDCLNSKPFQLQAFIDSTMYGADKIKDCLIRLTNHKTLFQTQWEDKTTLLKSLTGGFQTYLFYAHAEANWDDPWKSYIQFPLNQPRRYDKLMYADIDSIDWRKTTLVILAGCETTGNRIYSGAGISGLQRSFLTGGAKQVLATLWKVDAAQVAFQISEFLLNLNLTGDAMGALQTMQQVAIAELKKDFYLKYPHPRYWGAYHLTGTTLAVFSQHIYADQFLR